MKVSGECCANIRGCGGFTAASLRRLHLNDKHYFVEPPKREKISSEEINKLGDVRSIVAQVNPPSFEMQIAVAGSAT